MTEPDSPQQRARERGALVWMCVLIGVNQLGFGAVIPVLPLYAQGFDVSQSAIGATVAIYGLARFLISVPTGQLADGLGRRPTLALGGLVSAVGNLWCALAGSFEELAVARFVAGAGAGLVVTAGAVVLADISHPSRRGRMMAIYQGVFLFAVGIGPFPGGLLAEHFGLAAPFAAYAVLGLTVTGVAWFAVPESRGFRERAGARTPQRVPLSQQIGILLRLPGFRLVSGVQLVQAFVRTGALFSIVPILASERLGLSATQIGIGFALGSIAGLLVTYPTGALADRHGRKMVIVPTVMITGVSMGLFCVMPTYPWYLAGCLLWGMASSAGGSAPAAYAADCAPPGMNAGAMSSYRMLGDLGYVIGPIALGVLADTRGAETAMWLSAAGLMLMALAFARWAPETHRGS